jgi:NADH dehydrogenase FAD-containing subunit
MADHQILIVGDGAAGIATAASLQVLSDECEPVSVGRQTPEPMLNKVDATR